MSQSIPNWDDAARRRWVRVAVALTDRETRSTPGNFASGLGAQGVIVIVVLAVCAGVVVAAVRCASGIPLDVVTQRCEGNIWATATAVILGIAQISSILVPFLRVKRPPPREAEFHKERMKLLIEKRDRIVAAATADFRSPKTVRLDPKSVNLVESGRLDYWMAAEAAPLIGQLKTMTQSILEDYQATRISLDELTRELEDEWAWARVFRRQRSRETSGLWLSAAALLGAAAVLLSGPLVCAWSESLEVCLKSANSIVPVISSVGFLAAAVWWVAVWVSERPRQDEEWVRTSSAVDCVHDQDVLPAQSGRPGRPDGGVTPRERVARGSTRVVVRV